MDGETMTYRKQLTLNMEFLWSFVIRSRDKFICQRHGKDGIDCSGVLQAAHLVTRNVRGIKYDLRNGRCLCQSHHKFFTHRPELWNQVCLEEWKWDFEYLTDKKWQHPDTAIDREAKFSELMAPAIEYGYEFPEYLPKLEAIQKWIDKQQNSAANAF
jgi:hypothetical protein